MINDLESLSHPPSKQKFAATLRLVSRISFWVQLVLGGISGIAVLLASFSRGLTTSSSGIGFGIFLAIVGILLLCFRVYWAFRYRKMAKILQTPNSQNHPKKEDVIQNLRIGLIVSLVGLLIAFIASEVTVSIILGKAVAQPQGVAIYQPENVIRSLDIFVMLANVNMIGAHFFGGVTSLGLLYWLEE
jgi:Ca2+/Na+ antiporter